MRVTSNARQKDDTAMIHWQARLAYTLAFGALVVSARTASAEQTRTPKADTSHSPRLTALAPVVAGPVSEPVAFVCICESFANLPASAQALHDLLRDGGELPMTGSTVGVRLARDGSLKITGPVSGPWQRAQRAVTYGGDLTVSETLTLVIADGTIAEALLLVGDQKFVLQPRGTKIRSVRCYREPAEPVPLAAAPHGHRRVAAELEVPVTNIREPAPQPLSKPEQARRAVGRVVAEHAEIAELEARLRELQDECAELERAQPKDPRLAGARQRISSLRGELSGLWRRASAVLTLAERAAHAQELAAKRVLGELPEPARPASADRGTLSAIPPLPER